MGDRNGNIPFFLEKSGVQWESLAFIVMDLVLILTWSMITKPLLCCYSNDKGARFRGYSNDKGASRKFHHHVESAEVDKCIGGRPTLMGQTLVCQYSAPFPTSSTLCLVLQVLIARKRVSSSPLSTGFWFTFCSESSHARFGRRKRSGSHFYSTMGLGRHANSHRNICQ